MNESFRERVRRFVRRQEARVSADYMRQIKAAAARWIERWGDRAPSEEELEAYGAERGYPRLEAIWLGQVGLQVRWPVKVGVQREYRVLLPEEQERLEGACEARWWVPFLRLALETGLRRRTIRQLRRRDLCGPPWQLVVPAQAMKTRRPQALLLSEELGGLLAKEARPEAPLVALPPERTFSRTFRRAAHRAGLEGLVPHDLRRTWVYRATQAGAGLHEVMLLGGWRSVDVLTRHYFVALPGERARGLARAISSMSPSLSAR